MKGKKSDPLFVSSFIQESIKLGAISPEQIAQRAQEMIFNIDQEIKLIENKKKIRSKLLDVISTFQQKNDHKLQESKLLPFYNLYYPNICHKLAFVLEENGIANLKDYLSGEAKLSIKQLVQLKIIKIDNKVIMPDLQFNAYQQFIKEQ